MKKHSGPLRGGSWFFNVNFCRSSYRNFSDPDYRLNTFGIRLCARKPVMPEPRALRGGSWFYSDYFCHSSYRNFNYPVSRRNVVGFRLCARKYTD